MLVSGTLHGAGAKNVNMHLCEKNSYVKKCLGFVHFKKSNKFSDVTLAQFKVEVVTNKRLCIVSL